MRMFFNFASFYLKQMIKSPLYLGTNLFMTIMLLVRFFININEEYEYMNYGNFIGEMMLIVQALFLLFMVYFHKLFSDEFKYGANQLFAGTFRVTLLKVLALLVNHLILLTAFTVIQIGMIFTYFYYSGIPVSQFYIETAAYTIVYWFMPFMLALLIGIFLALVLGKKHIVFVFMILIWIGLGPVNTTLFSDYFRSLSSSSLGNLIMLGPLNSSDVYREVIGYNLNTESFVQNGIWILVMGSLVIVALFKFVRTQRDKLILTVLTTFLLVSGISLIPYVLKGDIAAFDYSNLKNGATVSETKSPAISQKELAYSIEGYDIKIQVSNDISAAVKVKLINLKKDADKLAFSLYHSLHVDRITNLKGKGLSFSQKGDFVIVHQPTETMVFEYTFNDSALLPAAENYLYLPGYISWIPKRSSHVQLKYDEQLEQEQILPTKTAPVDYQLEISGSLPTLYTNLSHKKGSVYSGKGTEGITLLAGAIKKQPFEDHMLIYPASWSNISKEWLPYEEALVKTHEYIVDMFGLSNKALPKDVVLLAPQLRGDSYLYEDHLLLHHGTLLTPSWAVHEIPRVYISALLWNENLTINQGVKEAFNELLVSFLQAQINYETPVYYGSMSLTPMVPSLRYKNDMEELGIISFYEKYSGFNEEEKRKFLIEWYEQMPELEDWPETMKFLENFAKETKHD